MATNTSNSTALALVTQTTSNSTALALVAQTSSNSTVSALATPTQAASKTANKDSKQRARSERQLALFHSDSRHCASSAVPKLTKADLRHAIQHVIDNAIVGEIWKVGDKIVNKLWPIWRDVVTKLESVRKQRDELVLKCDGAYQKCEELTNAVTTVWSRLGEVLRENDDLKKQNQELATKVANLTQERDQLRDQLASAPATDSGPPQTGDMVWQCQHGDEWVDMPAAISNNLTTGYGSYCAHAIRLYEHANRIYEADFDNMTQRVSDRRRFRRKDKARNIRFRFNVPDHWVKEDCDLMEEAINHPTGTSDPGDQTIEPTRCSRCGSEPRPAVVGSIPESNTGRFVPRDPATICKSVCVLGSFVVADVVPIENRQELDPLQDWNYFGELDPLQDWACVFRTGQRGR